MTGNDFVTVTYTVTNTGTDSTLIRPVAFADTSGNGVGLFKPGTPRTIGSLGSAGTLALEEDPSSPWSGYEEGTVSNVEDHLPTALRDEYITTKPDDDAIAAEWATTRLEPSGSATFTVRWRGGARPQTFTPETGSALSQAIAEAPAGSVIQLADTDYTLDSQLVISHDVTIAGDPRTR